MSAILPPATPDAATLATPQGQQAWKSAQEFEGMALGALLQPMFATVDLSKSPFGGGEAEQSWQPMLIDAIAKKIAAAGGLGLAVPVFNQIIRMQEKS